MWKNCFWSELELDIEGRIFVWIYNCRNSGKKRLKRCDSSTHLHVHDVALAAYSMVARVGGTFDGHTWVLLEDAAQAGHSKAGPEHNKEVVDNHFEGSNFLNCKCRWVTDLIAEKLFSMGTNEPNFHCVDFLGRGNFDPF